MPAKLTEDGKPDALFEQIAQPFIQQNWNVLSLGKPGVEFFSHWDKNGGFDLDALFYAKALYKIAATPFC